MKTNSRRSKRPVEAKTSRTAKRKGDYVQRRVRHKTFGQLFAAARKTRAYKDEGISLDMDAIAHALRLPFVIHKSGRGKPGRGSCWVVKSLYPHPQTATAERGEIIQECAPTLEEALEKFRARVCVPKTKLYDPARRGCRANRALPIDPKALRGVRSSAGLGDEE